MSLNRQPEPGVTVEVCVLGICATGGMCMCAGDMCHWRYVYVCVLGVCMYA